jgi:hypothetical protein
MQVRPLECRQLTAHSSVVQTLPDAAQALWQTPPGAVHYSVVQTRPDAAQVLWQTPPGAEHSSVVQTRPDAAQAPVVYRHLQEKYTPL